MAAKYRSALHQVLAVRYDGKNGDEVLALDDTGQRIYGPFGRSDEVANGLGWMELCLRPLVYRSVRVYVGDWVVKLFDGRVFMYSPEHFEAVFTEIPDVPPVEA